MAKKPKGEPPQKEDSADMAEEMRITPLVCMEDGCKATTWLIFPGKEPFNGAMFKDKGWAVLNEPADGQLVFICPDCFAKEMKEGLGSDAPAPRGG
jgi:hypothetical protein